MSQALQAQAAVRRAIDTVLLSAAKGIPVLIYTKQFDVNEVLPDATPVSLIHVPDGPEIRELISALTETTKHKFDTVLGIYDSHSAVRHNEAETLREIFSVVVYSAEAGIETLLVEFFRASCELSLNKVSSGANLTRKLLSTTYALRVENEKLRTSVYELSRTLEQHPKLVTTTTIAAPGAGSLNLYEADVEISIKQRIFRPSRGFCGFDLHFPYPPAKRRAETFILLRSGDNNDVLGEWVVDPSVVYGWVHCPLDVPLQEGVTSLVIEIFTFAWGHPEEMGDDYGKISLGLNSLGEDANVSVAGSQRASLSLATRVWIGPPGKLLPYAVPFAAQKLATNLQAAGYFIPISANDKNIGNSTNLEIENISTAGVQFRIGRAESEAQLYLVNFVPTRAARFFASIEAPQESGLLVQAKLIDPRASQNDPSTEAPRLFERAFYVGAGSAAPIDVVVPDPDRQYDLTVDLKLLDPKVDAVTARLTNFRGEWAPTCAKPLRVDRITFESLIDQQQLTIVRNRRVFTFTQDALPSVELLCPIHRIDDAQRLKVNLDRLVKGSCGAAIVTHGTAEFDSQVRSTIQGRKGLRFINISKEHNLGFCLNRAAETSSAEYLLKVDADDIYYENFATDLVKWAVSSGASIVGKAQFALLFEEDDELCYFSIDRTGGFVEQIAGGTICFRRDLHKTVQFNEILPRGTDKVFLLDAQAAGARVFSGDGMNYIHTRRRDVRRHTWNGSNEEFRSADYRLVGSSVDVEMFRV